MKKFTITALNRIFQTKGYRLVKVNRGSYTSETSKCRERLGKYLEGYGVDLGFGGDPIAEHAVRVDQPLPYASTGLRPVQLGGDATKLHWFQDEVLDFVYSSHLLEDFENTEEVLKEWWRVLKPGGRLIIFCPDEQVYRKHCAASGQTYNVMHKHADFSLAFVKRALAKFTAFEVVHECPLVDIYSWELVCRKAEGVRPRQAIPA